MGLTFSLIIKSAFSLIFGFLRDHDLKVVQEPSELKVEQFAQQGEDLFVCILGYSLPHKKGHNETLFFFRHHEMLGSLFSGYEMIDNSCLSMLCR